MTVLDRLKMELSNQEYFPEEQYVQYLHENDLVETDEYVKSTMQKSLYLTVIDVFEAVANDIDIMTGISTEFANIGQAYAFIEVRIQQLKDKIAAIPDEDEEYSSFSLMFTNSDRRNYTPKNYGSHAITRTEIDNALSE